MPPLCTSSVGLTPERLFVIAMATALGSLSIDLYLPAFPDLAAALHTSEAAVQITLTACVIGLAVGQLVAGPISDALGRRAPIVAGLLGWGAASLLCALAPSIEAFTVLRFAQGLAGAAGLVVGRAVVRVPAHRDGVADVVAGRRTLASPDGAGRDGPRALIALDGPGKTVT